MAWTHENSAANSETLRRPITLPALNLPDTDVEAAAKEAVEHLTTMRIVAAGRDAWNNQLGKSFEFYVTLGKALCVGKSWSMNAAKTNTAWGARYSKRFNEWLIAHGFNNIDMLKSTRSHCIELVENLSAIQHWRATALTEKQRHKLQGPQQNVRRWRRETQQATEPRRNEIATALAAWRRFVSSVKSLPADQAAMVWPAVLAEATALAQ